MDYSRVIRFIYQHRDGDIAEQMQKKGACYNASYGLSTHIIKREAEQIGQSQELALKLWNNDIREAKIFALYLMEPHLCSEEFLDGLVMQLQTVELAQLAAMTVLCNANITGAKLCDWCSSPSLAVKLAGYNTLIRKIKTGKPIPSEFGTLFAIIENDVGASNTNAIHTISLLLEAISSLGEKETLMTIALVKKTSAINNKESGFLVENVMKPLEEKQTTVTQSAHQCGKQGRQTK